SFSLSHVAAWRPCHDRFVGLLRRSVPRRFPWRSETQRAGGGRVSQILRQSSSYRPDRALGEILPIIPADTLVECVPAKYRCLRGGTPMRVFVSSTCHDLIDLRAVLETELREMGASPVFSDSKTSDFEVSGIPDQNSIETCLVNVRNSDIAVFVLAQRYGPPLPAPFGGISATHLEWREAVKEKKSRYFYV